MLYAKTSQPNKILDDAIPMQKVKRSMCLKTRFLYLTLNVENLYVMKVF